MLAHRAQLVAWLSAHVQLYRARGRPAGWAYYSPEDLLLTLGHWGIPALLPQDRPRGPEQMCYANASSYSETYNLTYVEGYGLTTIGYTFAHAWCVDDQGHVHDPTWPDGTGMAYLGIPFSTTYIQEFNEQFGNACLLHDAHVDGHRILREGLPTDALLPIGDPVTTAA